MSSILKHKHHIIPRHMGGTNDSSNIIELTVEEHAKAHLDLYLKYNKIEDYYAHLALSGQISGDEARRFVCKHRMLNNNPMKNPKTLEKMRKTKQNQKLTDETKRKISNSLLNVKKSKQHSENIGKAKSKNYIVYKPDGTSIKVSNLSVFCAENNLTESLMYKVASGNRKHHKGYKCIKV